MILIFLESLYFRNTNFNIYISNYIVFEGTEPGMQACSKLIIIETRR